MITQIQSHLTQDLLKPQFRGHSNPYWGHCYVASEVAYHLKYKELGFKPFILNVDGITHWFLKNPQTQDIVDITKDQFDFDLDYNKAKGCGFLTKSPSKRSQILMERIK